MREFKFRAWDKEKCFMFIPVQIELAQGENFSKWDEWKQMAWRDELPEEGNGGIGRFIGEECEVMQYTGLKDKNGKEIYEGDIVRAWEQDEYIPERDSGGGIIGFDRRDGFSQIGVVSFKGAWFTYETKKYLEGRKEKIYAPLDFVDDLVIIGNIYENPELLEG